MVGHQPSILAGTCGKGSPVCDYKVATIGENETATKPFGWLVWLVVERVSFYTLGCPGTSSTDQAALELTEIHLPLLPKCWD